MQPEDKKDKNKKDKNKKDKNKKDKNKKDKNLAVEPTSGIHYCGEEAQNGDLRLSRGTLPECA